jgi:hypothetical protein
MGGRPVRHRDAGGKDNQLRVMLEHLGVRAPQSSPTMRYSDIIPEHACGGEPILRTNRCMFTSLGVPLAAPSYPSADSDWVTVVLPEMRIGPSD